MNNLHDFVILNCVRSNINKDTRSDKRIPYNKAVDRFSYEIIFNQLRPDLDQVSEVGFDSFYINDED
jgi:hypothetical protein